MSKRLSIPSTRTQSLCTLYELREGQLRPNYFEGLPHRGIALPAAVPRGISLGTALPSFTCICWFLTGFTLLLHRASRWSLRVQATRSQDIAPIGPTSRPLAGVKAG